MNSGRSIHIFAVGNPYYGDDGVGQAILEILQSAPEMKDVVFYNAQTDALSLIDRFSADGLNIIIDAACMGYDSGAVVRFTPDETQLKIKSDNLSLHGFGLPEAFQMATQIGVMPANLVIIGIEPAVIEMNEPLSEPVRAAIPEAIKLINNEVKLYESAHDFNH